ncbi:transposase [Anaerovirgula multivorans]|uniref:Transposase n=1 Tax=Anaerovirgula multivorans TaxID=312168 RepID=A0A239JGA5_9FIRM|nr:transposase [Anaerovirgula multivorans]SNT04323.1 transposase [Anaerovirgula multivorans]
MGKSTKHFNAEFKQDAVNYYYSSGKTIDEIAKELKIARSTLSKWINSAKSNDGIVEHRGSGNYSSDAEKEIARLKKELRDSKDALEILKKAIGILND